MGELLPVKPAGVGDRARSRRRGRDARPLMSHPDRPCTRVRTRSASHLLARFVLPVRGLGDETVRDPETEGRLRVDALAACLRPTQMACHTTRWARWALVGFCTTRDATVSQGVRIGGLVAESWRSEAVHSEAPSFSEYWSVSVRESFMKGEIPAGDCG